MNVKELLKENGSGKDEFNEYGDISQGKKFHYKVDEKTLKGIIHYLKVPRSKPGQ